jgi:hypothetical protein
MCLQILFVTLQSTNKLSGAVAGEQQLHYLQTQFVLVSFSFSFLLPLPPLSMGKLSLKSFSILWDVFTILFNFLSAIFTLAIPEQPSIHNHYAPKSEFSDPSSPFSSSYELDPGIIAMVRKRPFSGEILEDPYDHLQEFEELCSSWVIPGMTQETLWWNLFPFSLIRRAE